MVRVPTFYRFRNDEEGAALVEFAIILPMMLLVFAMAIESGRTFWAYQTTIAGVRDATRYIGRSVDRDICRDGGSLDGWTSKVTDIVRNASNGSALYPDTITVASVTPTLDCVTGGYRRGTVSVATVEARLQIEYPFSGLFAFVGVSLPAIDTVVSDSGRIFGA